MRPATPEVTGSVDLTVGDTAVLKCESSSKMTGETYTWTKNGNDLPNENSDEYLVPAVGLLDMNAKYQCAVIFNGVVSNTSGAVILKGNAFIILLFYADFLDLVITHL